MSYVPLKKFNLTGTGGAVAAPGSGATIALWSSAEATGPGRRFKRLVLRLRTSHDSAALGLRFQEKSDTPETYRDLTSVLHPAATSDKPFTRYDIDVAASFLNVEYQNSANVLTVWEGELLGDTDGVS